MPILEWLGREKDVQKAHTVPYRLLEDTPELSFGDADSPNMLIQGDNLEALKALLPYYAGQVKCIFIDPPYNTKSAFEHYDDSLEHSKWLSMMYPRLELLRDLLADNGFMFVQIDYRESARLKIVLDELFGASCFRNEIIVGRGVKNIQSQFDDIDSLASGHDTIYLYAKNKSSRVKTLFAKTTEAQPGKWDTFWRGTDRPTMRYDLFGITPSKGQWRWSKERAMRAKAAYEEYVRNYGQRLSLDEYWREIEEKTGEEPNFIRFGASDTVQYYVGPRDYKMLSDVWLDLKVLGKITDFPHEKHEELLARIISWVTVEGDFVLDSFLGSGTTAAVAHKLGRHYIGIEMGDHAVTHCQPRLKKVVEGEQGGISEVVKWNSGGGFRFFKLGSTIFDAAGNINPDISFPHLAAHIWFCETKTALQRKKNPLSLVSMNQQAQLIIFSTTVFLATRRSTEATSSP